MSSHEEHDHSHYHLHTNERATKIVVVISAITMVIELAVGYNIKSLALTMDGWHMMSHVLVLSLAWGTYGYMKWKNKLLNHQNEERILSLSAFASAIVLLIVTIVMLIESFTKFRLQELSVTTDALIVSIIGLIVNGVCAFYLHREEDQMDINMRAAYVHVLSDILLSILALVSLVASKYFEIHYLDPICGIIAGAIIMKWSIGLISKSWREVLGW